MPKPSSARAWLERTGAWYAAGKISSAVKKNMLKKLSVEFVNCVDCGARARHYDHRDYNRPLDVSPVCVSCNLKRGPAKILASSHLRRERRELLALHDEELTDLIHLARLIRVAKREVSKIEGRVKKRAKELYRLFHRKA